MTSMDQSLKSESVDLPEVTDELLSVTYDSSTGSTV